MNYLAHTLLAGDDAALQVGGVLGDFWHGAPDPAWPPALRAGLLLHRHIDTYTDRHALVVQARSLFVAPLRRYAGILLDMYFDHLLARDFARYSQIPLAAFSAGVMQRLQEASLDLPAPMRDFIHFIGRRGGLAAYADPRVIERVLRGIGQRLRQPNPLAECMPALLALDQPLSEVFVVFFPQLQAFAAAERTLLLAAPAPDPSP